MLEDHAADFIGTLSSSGYCVYGEQCAESIHKIFRTAKSILLNATSHDTSAEYAKKRTL